MSEMQLFYEQMCTKQPSMPFTADVYWQKLRQVCTMSTSLLRRLSSFVVWNPW